MKWMKSYKNPLSISVATLVTASFYFVFFSGVSQWVGWLIFFLYLLTVGYWWKIILSNVFSFDPNHWTTHLYSYFITFLLLGLINSVWVVLYRVTPEIIWWNYFATAVVTYGILYFTKKVRTKSIKVKSTYRPLFSKSVLYLIAYAIFWALAIKLLLGASAEQVIFSPWQGISTWFLPLSFILLVICGLLVFSKHKTYVVLFVFVLQSLLTHTYIATSHNLPFGGDVWRIIGVEEQLDNGDSILPVIAGPEKKTREIFGINVPEALIIPNKYAYGHLWGSTVLLSKTLSVDLITLNKWLIPVLWGIMMPIILFRIGLTLFRSRRSGLFLVWLGFNVFAFQVLGSITLPVSLGYLTFFFVLSLLLQYIEQRGRAQMFVILLLSLLMLFSYTLHFLFIVGTLILTLLLLVLEKRGLSSYFSRHRVSWQNVIRGVLALSLTITLPLFELFGIANTTISTNIVNNIKQIAGQLSGWFYAKSIRSHDIVSGNIFFNHTPENSFVESVFTNFRWNILVITLIFWIIAIIGWYIALAQTKRTSWNLISMLTSVTIGGYIFGWTVLQGDRLFIRRLDGMIVFLTIILIVYGAQKLKPYWKSYVLPGTALILIILLSWFGTTVYASGPDLRVISQSELDVAKIIWEQENRNQLHNCVIADTWLLLALEGVSAGNIVGGGFPIDYQFGQPDRVRLYSSFTSFPEEVLVEAGEITKSTRCWVVQEGLEDVQYNEIKEKIGDSVTKLDNLTIWIVDLKKEDK